MSGIFLNISEEYGNKKWYAVMTAKEYDELKARWKTMRGLNCLVPVTLIVPQATMRHPYFDTKPMYDWQKCIQKNAHIHESSDSFLEDVNYRIPKARNFWLEGKEYLEADIEKAIDKELRISNDVYQPEFLGDSGTEWWHHPNPQKVYIPSDATHEMLEFAKSRLADKLDLYNLLLEERYGYEPDIKNYI